MFKTETELQLELFPRNWTETETEIMSGTEISLEMSSSNLDCLTSNAVSPVSNFLELLLQGVQYQWILDALSFSSSYVFLLTPVHLMCNQ